MTVATSVHAGRLTDDVERCAAELLIENGPRQLRSAHIAKRAGIPESTLFRKYKNVDEILAATYEWSWNVVNSAVIDASFAKPLTDPRQTLLQDAQAIFAMRGNPLTANALYTAFFMMRRRHDFKINEACEAQRVFEVRLRSLCRSVLEVKQVSEPRTVDVVGTMIMNYIATVCLTWLLMPTGTEDITVGDHDLSIDEALMGIGILLDKDFASGLGSPMADVET
jgi:AcrR family transcriptional regulator